MLLIYNALLVLLVCVDFYDFKKTSIVCNGAKSLAPEEADAEQQFCNSETDAGTGTILDHIDEHILDIKGIMQTRHNIPIDLLKKIDAEVSRLRSMQGDPFAEEPQFNRVEISQQFMQWCMQHGIHYNGLEIRSDAEGFGLGLFTTKKFYPDDIVITVSKNALITYQSTVAEVGDLVPEELKEDDQLYLMMKVLIERLKPTPRWAPYIDLLPRNFSLHPVCFRLEDLSMLQGSPAYFRVLESSIGRLSTYAILHRHFRDNPTLLAKTPLKLETFTLNAFEWATMVPATRAYRTNAHGPALIPLFDLQNHADINAAAETVEGNDVIKVIVQGELKSGEELLLHYDHRCKIGEFYSTWGFSCSEEDLFRIPARVAQRLNLPLLKSDDAEMLKDQRRYLKLEWKRIWSKYIELARNRLSRYAKSLDENKRIMSNEKSSLSFGGRANLLQVTREQKILHGAIQSAEAFMRWNSSHVEQFAQQLLEKYPKIEEKLPDIEFLFEE